MQIAEETRPIKVRANAELVLPHSSLILPPRDDTAEYDDTGDNHNFQDDPKYVFFLFCFLFLVSCFIVGIIQLCIKNLLFFFRLVVWRKSNKAVIKLRIIPDGDLEEGESQPVTVGFVMQYGYVNTITTLEHKAPQKLDLKIKLYLTVGNIVGNA